MNKRVTKEEEKKKKKEEQEEEKEEEIINTRLSAAADNITMAGSVTTVAKDKNGAVHKHCGLGDCADKFISGPNWSRHIKKEHSDMNVKELKDGTYYTKCAGEGCNACAKGKY